MESVSYRSVSQVFGIALDSRVVVLRGLYDNRRHFRYSPEERVGINVLCRDLGYYKDF